MKEFVNEYGKTIVAALLAALALLLLFSDGAVSLINKIKPESYKLSDSKSTQVIKEIANKGKVALSVRSVKLTAGEGISLSKLVTDASQGSTDLKPEVRYYLWDGSEVTGDYILQKNVPGIYRITFSVEGEMGVTAEASVAIQIAPNDKVPPGSELLEEWDIGMTANECYARLYRNKDGGTLLLLEGKGICKEFALDEIPWNAYMEQITACQIEETMLITAMDGWFEQAISLKMVPRLPDTVKSLSRTFAGCRSLTAGAIPLNAQNVEGMYRDCVNLQYVNQIPKSVENCRETFRNCGKLRGQLVLKAVPLQSEKCFWDAATDTDDMYLRLLPANEVRQMAVELVEDTRNHNAGSKIALQ